MALININSSVNDIFYRYKMPRIVTKHEGKGNGVKTVLLNVTEIGKAIGRPAAYITKYFGCELGAQTQMDPKNEKYVVNGIHTNETLQNVLNDFIKKFVLCASCDNPETNLEIKNKKSTSLTLICKACGFSGPPVSNHKVTGFILRSASILSQNCKKSPDDQKCKEPKIKIEAKQSSSGQPKIESFSDIRIPVKDNESWVSDTSEDGVLARQAELGAQVRKLIKSEEPKQQRLDKFYDKVKETLANNLLNNNTIYKELLSEAQRLDVADKASLILVQILLSSNMIPEILKYRSLFLFFTYNNPKAQNNFIRGIEQLVAGHPTTLLKKVPKILKICYDKDILDEHVLINWATGPAHKSIPQDIANKIRFEAEPFIRWLQETDEESDDSKGEDYLSEVYACNPQHQEDPNENDEIDIDKI